MFRPWETASAAPCVTVPVRRRVLSLDAKEIVRHVHQKLVQRGWAFTPAVRETSDLTGIPESSVRVHISRPIHPRRKRNDSGVSRTTDDGDKDLIRRTIYSMYEENLVPTIRSLQTRLRSSTEIRISIGNLWTLLSKLGFKYCKIDKRQVIMESQRIRQWRFEYLTAISDYRSLQRPIIYLDETWYDTHDTPAKGWTDGTVRCQSKAPSNKGKRITIIHAGSEDGWIPNSLGLSAKNIQDSSLDYHQDTTAELFKDWFENTLLPNIPPHSVIVMDNASYHSRQLKKVPGSSNTKAEIQEFMLQNNMYFEEGYKKTQLLEVLRTFNIQKTYVCDTIAASKGHTVLRLPPYYCVFNPIEHMWRKLKNKVRTQNTIPTLCPSVIALIRQNIDDPDADCWKRTINHVIKVEDSYRAFHTNIEPLIINVDDDSDSETELIY